MESPRRIDVSQFQTGTDMCYGGHAIQFCETSKSLQVDFI